ncbi:alpha/beta fold hydrolase [Gordonia polyisoprenivorans]|uniref:alpha/beta fold hydrolase n=1 Tax=Gordonia polyisoprenivorans TaxID=84595 RepID=UPI001B8C3215|nr:alpha/beta fold hydrolase [Gordonia polyisoprenivorans]QUD82422.1 alpha/beta fold hydrolase [Gordonia polyisoprenivorans]
MMTDDSNTGETGRISEFGRDGYVFDVLDSGRVRSGEVPGADIPIVLLHGFPERAACWNLVTPILNERGYRTVAPDQRGYSPRARPAAVRDYRISELARDVIALADTLDAPKIHLVGHDWGSGVAWAVAADYPDRVATLTALAVPHPGAYLRAMPRGQLLRSWYMGVFQIPGFAEWALSKGMSNPRAARFGPPGFAEQLQTDIIDYGALTGGLNWYRALKYGDRGLMNRKVTVPTTHIWSDGDVYLSRAGARGCAQMVDAPYDFIVLEGVDHWIPQRRPEQVAEAILARIA